jgi:hypothetical protein
VYPLYFEGSTKKEVIVPCHRRTPPPLAGEIPLRYRFETGKLSTVVTEAKTAFKLRWGLPAGLDRNRITQNGPIPKTLNPVSNRHLCRLHRPLRIYDILVLFLTMSTIDPLGATG